MPETVPVTPAAAGQRIAGRYALQALLDPGVRAPLYRADDTKLQRSVAIEVLHDIAPSGMRRTRFERAAASVAALSHPNIVAILDHGAAKEGGYLVSEWLSGETLARRMQREALSTDQTLSIARQLLAALACMHAAGLVHRNLKPSLVFLQRSKHGRERVKLIGLGSAALGASELLSTERALSAAEKSRYLAPEQGHGATADPRSDVYAVGAILAEALSNVLPERAASEPVNSEDTVVEAPPQLLKPSLGVALQALIARATADDPKHRFADAAEMLCELVDGLPRAPRWSASDEPSPDITVVSPPPFPMESAAFVEPVIAAARASTAVADVTLPPPAAGAHAERASRWQQKAAGLLGALGVTLLLVSLFTSTASRRLFADLQSRVGRIADGSLLRTPRLEPAPGAAVATDVDGVLTPEAEPTSVRGSAPKASGSLPVRRSVSAVQRLASRNPWLDPVPTELQGLPALIATGADVDGNVIRTLRQFTLEHMDDPRGHLLLGHAYLNRLWRADGLFEITVALRRDPTSRGAPEVLPMLVELVVQGKVAEPATALIEKTYGPEALGAIEHALGQLRNTEGAGRLRALRSRLLAELEP